jgi:hypothetical protein
MVRLYSAHQSSGKWREWTSRETVSRGRAERMVASGKAQVFTRMVDGELTRIYRATVEEKPLHRSPATLTFGTMEAVADAADGGKKENSKAAVLKFRVWPVVPETFRDAEGNFVEGGVYKATTIRPRLPLAERTAAEALLAVAPRLGLRIKAAAGVQVA